MEIFNGKIEGDHTVSIDFRLTGMVAGNITVAPNATLHLDGMCAGSLFVSKGASAYVSGTVVGDVVNDGVVEVRGIVRGDISSKGGRFWKSSSAVVEGQLEI